jgi:arginyl-tRNA synthetase
MRKFDAHLDFDLELAKSQTPENPVFYIQYAHARIESVKAQAQALPDCQASVEAAIARLIHPLELKLLKLMIQYENHVESAERTLEPYRLVAYLMELASAFHRFYTDVRVISEDPDLSFARLLLIDCVQAVIRSGLTLLGISAPRKM